MTGAGSEESTEPAEPLTVVIACADRLARRVRYVLDTLLMAAGIPVVHSDHPPARGPWLLYTGSPALWPRSPACLRIAHCPLAWSTLEGDGKVDASTWTDGL